MTERGSENASVVLERTFNAPIEKVWTAITDIDQMKLWYFPQLEEFRAEKDFKTEFNVHHEGKDWLHIWKITEVIPQKKIALEWKFGGYPGNSLLSFELFPEGDKTRFPKNTPVYPKKILYKAGQNLWTKG